MIIQSKLNYFCFLFFSFFILNHDTDIHTDENRTIFLLCLLTVLCNLILPASISPFCRFPRLNSLYSYTQSDLLWTVLFSISIFSPLNRCIYIYICTIAPDYISKLHTSAAILLWCNGVARNLFIGGKFNKGSTASWRSLR